MLLGNVRGTSASVFEAVEGLRGLPVGVARDDSVVLNCCPPDVAASESPGNLDGVVPALDLLSLTLGRRDKGRNSW